MCRSARSVAGVFGTKSMQKCWLLDAHVLFVVFWRRIRSEGDAKGGAQGPGNAVLCGNKLSPGEEKE